MEQKWKKRFGLNFMGILNGLPLKVNSYLPSLHFKIWMNMQIYKQMTCHKERNEKYLLSKE